MHHPSSRRTVVAAAVASALAFALVPAHAEDAAPAGKVTMKDLGIELWGYMRSGFYAGAKGEPTGQYQLAGPLDHYRLGNDGDNYIEFGIGKKTDLGGGLKWGVYWMPTVYNGGTGNAQIYSDITGFDFAPGATFWGGQRYHRIQDVYIIDNWVMEDGDNYGVGVDDLNVGLGKLNVAAYTEGNSGNKNANANNAKRLNVQWHDIPVNPGGKLNITGAVVHGQFGIGADGGAVGLLHKQEIAPDVSNNLFLQFSNGHAEITGKFLGLDNGAVAQPGAKQARVMDMLNWQAGAFGGMAFAGIQSIKPTGGNTTRDFSLGGRVSYGVARYVKLLADVGYNHLTATNAASQNLMKETVAVALAPDTKFWTHPEFRAYVTHANWNDAAGLANAATFGHAGRTSANAYGLQVEAWW